MWRASGPGERYCVVPVLGDEALPYAVCKVSVRGRVVFEAWLRAVNARGSFWGGEVLGRFDGPDAARGCCLGHWRGPAPG